jgi:hypothetical protein
MLIAGQPGPPASSNSDGVAQPLRTLKTLELGVSEVHGRYFESSYRGARFGGANQAAVALTAAFATTYTGLVLYNPNGTNVIGVLEKVGVGQTLVGPAAAVLGLMTGQSTTAFSGVTAITPKSKKVGSGITPVLQLAGAATLPIAPTLDTVIGALGTGATTVYGLEPIIFDIGGDILIPPGAFVALYASAALTAALIASFQWEEVPL